MLPDGFRELSEGIGFTEGPVWTSSGELFVTSMSRGLVYQLDSRLILGGPIRAVETGGGPNGLAEGRDGRVYVAQNGGATMKSRSERPTVPGIQSFAGDDILDHTSGGFTAPNDIALGPDGSFWLTDPDSSEPKTTGGRVWRVNTVTGDCQLVISDVEFPNGLAFGLDSSELFVADTTADEIIRYRVANGTTTDRTRFAHSPGGPDGIAFDGEGNLYVAAFEADEVQVFNPSGDLVRTLPTGHGSRPTNLCFAGPELQTLVVTLAKGGRVIALEETLPGVNPTDVVNPR